MEKIEIKFRFLKNILVTWSHAIFKAFFLYDWLEKGFVCIGHIYNNRNKQVYSLNEVQNLSNVPQTDLLSYHQLIACIPTEWKNKLREEEINYRAPEYLFEKLVPELQTCCLIYNMLLEKKTNIQTGQESQWEDNYCQD